MSLEDKKKLINLVVDTVLTVAHETAGGDSGLALIGIIEAAAMAGAVMDTEREFLLDFFTEEYDKYSELEALTQEGVIPVNGRGDN